jgi:hypothetical protein
MNVQSRYKFLSVLSAVVLLSVGILAWGPKVNAAGEGKITGSVKLNGTAPHMRGIDMSKEPYCSKAHESNPAVRRRSGKCRFLPFRRPEWQ